VTAAIETRGLGRTFKVPVREPGLVNAVRSLVKREHELVEAVQDVDLHLDQGEVVGFLGANGAGKTTTLKMLSGLLHPTAGEARVLGFEPRRRDHELLRRITLVMGNRNQLQWDLPVEDSFEMHRAVYGLAEADYRTSRDELVELLDLGDLLERPVRNLSLGQRMKAEIAGSLLHRPQVLFLDEPTIGLDVTMQKRIRAFLAEHNRRHGSTIVLTSHYMADVQALCDRVVVIHRGTIRHDGPLGELATRFAPHRTLTFTLPDPTFDAASIGEVTEVSGGRA
jgi:ABC-2 type transport system ATP-binding protein